MELEDFIKMKVFDGDQILQIRLGLDDNLEVNAYAKAEYDALQMQEIRLGLKANIDVSAYMDSNLSWEQMFKMRFSMLPVRS